MSDEEIVAYSREARLGAFWRFETIHVMTSAMQPGKDYLCLLGNMAEKI